MVESGRKHAFLILAHTEFEVLKRLLECLDDSRNEIFIHFDSKVKNLPLCHTENAVLHILKNRIDIRWGDYSMIKAELALFEAARGSGPFLYYHLLSGVDLPLKSQDFLHRFFSEHCGKEFIGYTNMTMTPDLIDRMQRWHLFPKKFKSPTIWEYHIRRRFLYVQQVVGFRRNKTTAFKKGPQWVSITDPMVQILLEKKQWIKTTFSHTFCPDESLFQTLCWDSSRRDYLYYAKEGDDVRGSLRLVGWRKNGWLEDWNREDFRELEASMALFARKFNGSDLPFLDAVCQLSQDFD